MTEIDEIHLVHHCHTDVGYTHDQPALWDLQRRFVDEAIDLVARDRDRDAPDAVRWTVETTWPLVRWLESAPPERVALFRDLESAGRIEVTAMAANVTPLYDRGQVIESLRPVRLLREEYGCTIRHAMNCDVNGQNWPLVDALLDAGIEGLSMAVNGYYGGSPFDRPTAFEWEGPSGRTLPTLDGFHYSTGYLLGIGRDAESFATEEWPRLERRLERIGYPLPALLVQSFHPFGDNGPPFAPFSSFVREWNAREDVRTGELPSIRLSTPTDWWAVVEEHRDALATHRGDWTDFWNFGAGSTAREVAVNRENRRRLWTADALEAGLAAVGHGPADRPPNRRAAAGTRDRAWEATNLFDEHTWGADTSVTAPDGEDARSQTSHKLNLAYEGRSLSHLLRRDGLAELAAHAERAAGDGAGEGDGQ
jgi:hypothetical protein